MRTIPPSYPTTLTCVSFSEEVVELFAVFFEHCHRQCPFLDPEVHTPTATGSRSPFLFTCSMFTSSLVPLRCG